jgi:hypothetical protein
LKELAADEGRREATATQYPSDETLVAFVGYMLEQKPPSGTTVQGCIRWLPAALAMYHGQPLHVPKLTLSKALLTIVANAACRVHKKISLVANPPGQPQDEELLTPLVNTSFNLEELNMLVENSTPLFTPIQHSELERDGQVVVDLVVRGRKHQKLSAAPAASRGVSRATHHQAEGSQV